MCIVTVRDVREIKGYQSLIQQNEELLLKMLPKSIAQRLKKALSKHEQGDEQLLIADSYPEVSILFADIVRFSDWSTKIDAERLVKILNILVSAWDAIALTFEVEKIKVLSWKILLSENFTDNRRLLHVCMWLP